MISISYIIPTYNNLNLLKRCINSVISQLGSFDRLIIVDDGSSDGTREYLHKTYSSNTQISLLYQENSGSGKARNYGIKHSTTSYVWFVDSDDYLPDGVSKVIKETLTSEESDVLYFNYYIKQKNGKMKHKLNINFDKFETIFLSEHYPWNKVMKRELFDSILFPEVKIRFQDHATIPRILLAANKINYIDKYLYIHDVSHDGNISKDNSKLKDMYKACEYLVENISGNNTKYLEFLLIKTFLFDRLYMIISFNKKELYIELKRIKEFLNESIPNWKNSRLLSFKESMGILKHIKNGRIKWVIANLFKISVNSTYIMILIIFKIKSIRE